jgi:hypothetical protein
MRLNPFDSIFLILRRVVSAPGLFPTLLPELPPEGGTLATYLVSALHDLAESLFLLPFTEKFMRRFRKARVSVRVFAN